MGQPTLKNESISYLLFQVRHESLEDFRSNLAPALDLVFNNEGVIETIMSSVVFATFKGEANPQLRPIDVVLDKFGPNVRAVYGHGEFVRGPVGSQFCFRYGTIFPELDCALKLLLELEFGTSREIQESKAQR